VEFGLLGPLTVVEGGSDVTPARPKQRALLALLLLRRGEVVPGAQLIEALWGEEPPGTAQTALYGHIAALRKLVGAERIRTRPPGYLLTVAAGELDLARFEALVAQARERDDPAARSACLSEALALWRGEPLAELHGEPFAEREIARLAELRVAALEERIEADLALGRHHGLVAELEPLVAEHPFRERLRGQLMLALYRSGRQADALHVYQRGRSTLAEELGLDPGPELRRLELRILHQDASLGPPDRPTADGQPVRGGTRTAGAVNLPAASTPLVGRERELGELVAMLSNGTRLLTITGPGGTGKTRLALQVAGELVSGPRDGVHWVPLAGLADPDLVPSEVARAIGARHGLTGFLRGKDLLLLLDNFEHLLAAAPVVSDILAASPRVRVLVTSRAPLRVSGEQQYRLEPLPRPEAAELFVQRARAVGCEIEPDATVEEICRRLDDLPLAIELAAARTRLLAPRRLLGRLDSALTLLTTGTRDAPERQRTLRATIEWSYDLLDPAARNLLGRLSAFSGAFSLEAAEDICGAELDDLATLVDYSLVKPVGDDRFLMLATIGSYAREKLAEASGEDELRRRHAAFFSALAEQAYRGRLDAEAEWSSRLEEQHDDLRAALDWLLRRDPDRALELAGALGWFWLSRGLLREGHSRLSAALTVSGMTGRSRARALAASGALLARRGDAAAGIAELDAAVAMWRELGDLEELASALDSLGWPLVYDAANNARALAAFEQSLDLWRELEDEAGVTRALVGIAQVLVAMGETERAEAISQDLLGRAAGDARTEHYAYHFLADCALIRGDPEEARTRYRHSLRAALALGDVLEAGWEVQGVAMAEAGAGDPRRALVLAGSVEALWESLGLASSIAFWDALLERYLAPARASLGDECGAVRAEGRALAFDDAVELALNGNAQPSSA
jgi:predicted ATPase/DNA-binding SARP family transcriptional activator